MSITPAEQDRLLRKALKRVLEQRGYFVKFSQDGGCTVLKGEPGGEQQVIDSGLTVLDAGKKYGLWGEDNDRTNHWELMHPTTSPDGSGRPTPFTVATIEKNRKDSREDNKNMSSKPSKARERAEKLIFDFKTESGAFENINKPISSSPAKDQSAAAPTKRTGDRDRDNFNSFMDAGLQHTYSDDARARMIQRQQTHKPQDTNAYLAQISRERWQSNSEGGPGSSTSPYHGSK